MAFFNEFPHTRSYDSDLGWLIWATKKLITEWEDFSNLNSIKFADPINWTIDRNYEPAMIVVDADGNGFISRKAVPAGVPLSNTDYWTQIFNFGDITDTIRDNIAVNAEESPTAPVALAENELVWWNGNIYKVLYDIAAGTAFLEGVNVEPYTVYKRILDVPAEAAEMLQPTITEIYNAIQEEVASREDADSELQSAIDAEAATRAADDTDLINDIAEVNTEINAINNELDKFGTNALFSYSRKYIDGVDGNDNNPGTIDAPYRTLDRFFQDVKYGGDVRAYIVSAGTYNCSLSVFENGTVHMTAMVAGVHIKFNPANGNHYLSVYNAHWNFSGVSMAQPLYIDSDSAVPHFENCSTTFTYVECDSGIYITGGYVGLDSCIFAAGTDTMSYLGSSVIRISGALGYIWGCLVNVNVARQYAIYLHNRASILYRGNANAPNIINFNVDDCGGCIYMYSADLEVIDTGMTFNNPSNAQYGLYMSNGHASMTPAMRNKFQAVGSGIYHSAIGELITGWVELPEE